MTEREKIITELEQAKAEINPVSGSRKVRLRDAVDEAIALLKEQEAVEPILKRQGRNKYYNYYVCRCCNEELFYQQNYCSECGRAVKWDD